MKLVGRVLIWTLVSATTALVIGYCMISYAFSHQSGMAAPAIWIFSILGFFIAFPFVWILEWFSPPLTDNLAVFLAFPLNGAFWMFVAFYIYRLIKRTKERKL